MPLKRTRIITEETCGRCGGLGYLGILSNVNLNPNATMSCSICKGKGWIQVDEKVVRE